MTTHDRSPLEETNDTLRNLRSLVSYYEALMEGTYYADRLAVIDAEILAATNRRSLLVASRERAPQELIRLRRKIADETRIVSLLTNPRMIAARSGKTNLRVPRSDAERVARVRELEEEIRRLKEEIEG
jgi:RecB family exonuclease